MSSNYPPGVSGNEYEIAGPSTEDTGDRLCPACDGSTLVQSFGVASWYVCEWCDWQSDPEENRDYDDRDD